MESVPVLSKLQLCVCVSLASDFLETDEVIIIKLGTVSASDMLMHHVLIILTMTLIQGHTDLNHYKYKKCSIISETIRAIPVSVLL